MIEFDCECGWFCDVKLRWSGLPMWHTPRSIFLIYRKAEFEYRLFSSLLFVFYFISNVEMFTKLRDPEIVCIGILQDLSIYFFVIFNLWSMLHCSFINKINLLLIGATTLIAKMHTFIYLELSQIHCLDSFRLQK